MWNIFEHPWTGLLIAFAVQFIFTIVHLIRPDSRKWWHFLPAVLVVLTAFAISYFVKTDKELIQEAVSAGIAAVEKEDLITIDRLIAIDYSDSHHNSKSQIMDLAREYLSKPLIAKNQTRNILIQIDDSKAVVDLLVLTILDPKNEMFDYKMPLYIKSRLYLKKYEGGNWLFCRAELLEINNQSFSWTKL